MAQESGSLVCSTIKTPHDLSSDRREAGRLLSADTIVFTWVVRKDPQVHNFCGIWSRWQSSASGLSPDYEFSFDFERMRAVNV